MEPALFAIRLKHGAYYVYFDIDLNGWTLTFDKTRAFTCVYSIRDRLLQEYLADNPNMRKEDFVFVFCDDDFYKEN